MLRGRCSCAISDRPGTPSGTQTSRPAPLPRAILAKGRTLFASSSLLRQLTPLFPLDASHSPVTPLFPLHTQKQGGGGAFRKMCPPITLLFSTAMLTSQLSAIVGAPTIACLRQRRSLPLLMPAPSPIDVHSGCRRERTPDSLHTLK